MKGTGVYFCTCGGVITEKVEFAAVERAIGQMEEVAYVQTMEFLCSEEGKAALEQDLKERSPERVVVAACSPRDHENTFRAVLAQTAINPYLLQMANIREHVAWVTAEAGPAVAKATVHIRGAVKRVNQHEPLHKAMLEMCPDVLVIGAGPAGLQAALSLAQVGRTVTLVEKSPVIGGMAVRYEEVFPRLECGPCLLEPILDEVLHGDHAGRIDCLTLAEVTDVAGFFGHFLVTIRRTPRRVDETTCIGCGECIPPCPVTAKNGFNAHLDDRKAIYFPFAGALPNFPLLDGEICLRFQGEGEGAACQQCQEACPVEGAILFGAEEERIEKEVGAILVAIGSRLYDGSLLPALGRGAGSDVYSSYEFERLLAQNGPTGGEVVTLRQGTPPAAVAIIHCVGSLDAAHCGYCSEVCCQNAFKFNHLIRKKMPDAVVYHLYRELVMPGKDGFALYQKIQDDPLSHFIRYPTIEAIRVDPLAQGYAVGYTDVCGVAGEVVADLVVLCPALVPSEDAASLATLLSMDRDRLGFFAEQHNRLAAVRSAVKGMYIAGTCQSPMDLQKAMSQGVAVAGYILSDLVMGRQMEIEPVTAEVDDARCGGCLVCLAVCPYKAIHRDEAGKKVRINALLCAGCGTCVAACPAGVIKGNHFTNEAIFAEIAGVLA